MMRHGDTEMMRGINAPKSGAHERGRFGRLFPSLPAFAQDTPQVRERLEKLGEPGGLMDSGAAPLVENDTISAGFTFLGQFLDHDLTFDPTSSLERQNDPEALTNFRTPQLELDHLYGSGPAVSRHLYDRNNPAKFLIDAEAPRDLPRNSQLTALISEPRNDENTIISQLHLAFLKFHNAVVDNRAAKGLTGQALFDEAQRMVRWHYQWIIVNEYLPRTVGEAMVNDVLRAAPHERAYRWRNEPFMPVEFAVAAFRFGHSQVRPGYALNAEFGAPIFNFALSATDADPQDLRGGKRAPRRFVEWRRFFLMGDPAARQLSLKIDTKLSPGLFGLPTGPGIAGLPFPSLAQRNLLRGLSFGLPSGQAMARVLRLPVLTPEQLSDVRSLGFDRSTPPWFYILKEAEVLNQGKRLGPLGGRIVAEVFIGALLGDRLSYLRANPNWKPTLGKNGEFFMGDLLRTAGVDI